MLSNIRGLLALVVAVAVTVVTAVLTGGGGGGGGPTTTTSSSSTSTSSSSTSTSAPGSTTTVGVTTTSAGPTTTTTLPEPADPDAAVHYTKLRVEIDNRASWFNATFVGPTTRAFRIVSTTGAARVAGGLTSIGVSGVGTATLDLVMQVPEGIEPVLATCKNHAGPTTITIRRLTDGDVTIAELESTGTSGTIPPDSCANRAEFPLDRSAMVGPTRWPARVDPRRLVLATYYPWYNPTTLQRNFGDNPIGPADTSDPAVVAEAVDLAAEHGIDGFLATYTDLASDRPRIDSVYAAAEARGDFQVALILGFDSVWGRDGDVSAADVRSMVFAIARWADSPAQLKIDGQPVVFVFANNRVNLTMWRNSLNALEAEHGIRPFVIDQNDALGADGGYVYGNGQLYTRADLFSFADTKLLTRKLQPSLTDAPLRLWVHAVQPGYDDTRLGRPAPFLALRADGQRYVDSWEAARTALPDWIVVSTWNEYYEQTHVMPGHTTGYRALEQTAEFAADFHANG